MRSQDFTKYLGTLEQTSSRNEMYRLLGQLFGKADAEETAQIAYLCEGRLLPAFEGIETGMGERNIAAAIASATKRTDDEVAFASRQQGDLGLVVESLSSTKRSRLSVSDVYESLLKIARTSGKGSTESKQKQLAALLRSATPKKLKSRARS